MTSLLQQAFRAAEQLPDADQDALASRILDEIQDEVQWNARFTGSASALERLSAEAWAEHESGETLPLDNDERG